MFAMHPQDADEFPRLRDPRMKRLNHTHQKLGYAVRDFVYSHPKAVALGPDPLVKQLLSASGFGALDYVSMAFSVGSVRATAVVVPARVWRDLESRALLLQVKVQADEHRTKVLLVPQFSLCGTLRGRIAATIAKSRGVTYAARHVDAVIVHVTRVRISTLAECAAVIPAHEDPVGVLLAMAAKGFLDLDRSKSIQASTWVTTSL